MSKVRAHYPIATDASLKVPLILTSYTAAFISIFRPSNFSALIVPWVYVGNFHGQTLNQGCIKGEVYQVSRGRISSGKRKRKQ